MNWITELRRKAIEEMYDGRCTVTIREEYDKPNGTTGFKEVVTIAGQVCRLSCSSAGAASKEDAATSIKQVIKLFIAPECNIPAGSRITITQEGVTQHYSKSGVPAVYDTHQEIVLELFRGWS